MLARAKAISGKTICGLREHHRLRGKDLGSTLGSGWGGIRFLVARLRESRKAAKIVGLGVPAEGFLPPDQVLRSIAPGATWITALGRFSRNFEG